MIIKGTFDTAAEPAALRQLLDEPERLAAVDQLKDVAVRADGAVTARFAPVTSVGRIALQTLIRPQQVSNDGAKIRVVGSRGNQIVTADIDLSVSESEDSGAERRIDWSADVLVGGTAASVGQRVAPDIARRAIDEVLRAVAAAATDARSRT